jgi:adenylate cyclase
MLNEYFGVMYDKITDNRGLLDKYIGDAIMAVFGAPFVSDRDADNAVLAAIDMMTGLNEFNELRRQDGKEVILTGIGVSTGEVVSGNIGSSKRMDYTVIGNGVNLAARLESATKVYKTPILLSDQTVKALTDSFSLREVDRIRVKGQTEPVALFEALDGLPQKEKGLVEGGLGIFQEAMDLYRVRDWEKARSRFMDMNTHHPTDHITQLYLDRCQHLANNPPPDHWDGVWTMTTK